MISILTMLWAMLLSPAWGQEGAGLRLVAQASNQFIQDGVRVSEDVIVMTDSLDRASAWQRSTGRLLNISVASGTPNHREPYPWRLLPSGDRALMHIDKSLHEISLPDMGKLRAFEVPSNNEDSLEDYDVSHDGRWVWAQMDDGEVHVLDLRRGVWQANETLPDGYKVVATWVDARGELTLMAADRGWPGVLRWRVGETPEQRKDLWLAGLADGDRSTAIWIKDGAHCGPWRPDNAEPELQERPLCGADWVHLSGDRVAGLVHAPEGPTILSTTFDPDSTPLSAQGVSFIDPWVCNEAVVARESTGSLVLRPDYTPWHVPDSAWPSPTTLGLFFVGKGGQIFFLPWDQEVPTPISGAQLPEDQIILRATLIDDETVVLMPGFEDDPILIDLKESRAWPFPRPGVYAEFAWENAAIRLTFGYQWPYTTLLWPLTRTPEPWTPESRCAKVLFEPELGYAVPNVGWREWDERGALLVRAQDCAPLLDLREARWQDYELIGVSPAGDKAVLTPQNAKREICLTTLPDNGGAPRCLTTERFADNVLLSPDGRMVAGQYALSTDGFLMDIESGVEHALDNVNYGLSFSADSTRLHIGPEVYDARSGEYIARLETLEGQTTPWNVKPSPDGRWLAGISIDAGQILLWDAETGAQVAALILFEGGDWAVLDPEGRFDRSRPDLDGLHFVLEQDGSYETIGLEQLERYYYEPRLLEKLTDPEQNPRPVVGFDLSQLPPKLDWSLEDERLRVTVRDRGGGVGRVALLIDGREVVTDLTPDDWDGGPFEVALDPYARFLHADAELSLQAWNAAERVSAKGGQSRIPPSLLEDQDLDPIDLFAIIVGTGTYADPGLSLSFPDDDARAMEQALRVGGEALLGAEGGAVHTWILSTEPGRTPPSPETFEEAFSAIQEAAGPEDILVVYLSGHGVTVDGRYHYPWPSAAQGDLSDPQLLAARALTQERLMDLIRATPAGKRLLVLDTCASGSFGARSSLAADAQKRAVAELRSRMGLVVLAGAPADAAAYERPELGHGLLTYALLEGMRGDAPLTDGRYWEVDALAQHAVERVPQLARQLDDAPEQSPVLTVPTASRGFLLGQLPDDPDAVAELRRLDLPIVAGGLLIDTNGLTDSLQLSRALDQSLSDLSRTQEALSLRWRRDSPEPTAWQVGGLYAVKRERVRLKLALSGPEGQAHRVSIVGDSGQIDGLGECAALWVDRAMAFESGGGGAPPKRVAVEDCDAL